MAFSYDLASTNPTMLQISMIRLSLGDDTKDAGVLPDGSNLSNEAILAYLAAAGNDSEKAIAALCALLARRWANVADVSVGPRRESLSQISKAWDLQAAKLAPTTVEAAKASATSFVTYLNRVDGYSLDARYSRR